MMYYLLTSLPSGHIFAILSYMKHLSLTKPHLIITVGIPGSGKSYFAEKFASTFGAPYICQRRIEKLTTDHIDELVQLQLDELLKTKQSIVFDGDSATRAERVRLSKKARDAGYETLLIWIQTDQQTAKMRATSKKATDTSTQNEDEFDRFIKQFTPPNAVEKPLVISGKHTYASQAKVVLRKLSAPRTAATDQDTPPARPTRPNSRNIVIR